MPRNAVQFIDFCILCGCDYLEPLKGVAAKTALKLIRENGDLAGAVEKLREGKNPPPDDWPWEEARELFLHPEVIKSEDLTLDWKAPDIEGLVDFLVREKGFKCAAQLN